MGVIVIALGARGGRWFGSLQRSLARHLLAEDIEDPDPLVARRGLFAWLQAALRDKTGWKAIAYLGAKTVWALFSVWFAFSIWWDAFACLGYPFFERGDSQPAIYGFTYNVLHPGFFSVGSQGVIHGVFVVATGVVLLFLAPWPMRLAVYVDRRLVHWLLGPDAVAARMRTLEAARASTVDASAALLRRIERDLHDGTQAQLVALAMRLGEVKESSRRTPLPTWRRSANCSTRHIEAPKRPSSSSATWLGGSTRRHSTSASKVRSPRSQRGARFQPSSPSR